MAREHLPVQPACRVLHVTESGHSAWRDRPPSNRLVKHAWLTEAIVGMHTASRGTYGSRRVHAELGLGLSIHVSHGTVELLMHRAGLHGLPGNRRPRTKHLTPSVANLVERNFPRQAGDQLWVTDITEHPTFEGKVYCAVVLATFSRRVVGSSIDASPTAALTTNALAMATGNRSRGRVAPSSTPITECSSGPGRSPSALGSPACCPRWVPSGTVWTTR
ncbi:MULTISPECIES: IS3 family transposase [unclassified Streptomyces]|uniref:IS3 family transposase n=1 Tax=unclassified Streptomyces TaxID=2593676 RepID=UPI0011647D01|nr:MULTISPECIES: IS3 family transposase [unclassified Streptomyces]QDN54624.1 IS3 family transposase [Streptomyces sp. S1D4-20]QDN64805.1 IS3 family transposase [Streptomyces sp. S1D4-14]QDO47213.1 IS3 family transposase [Streptomyces sp. RLB3-5]QDO57452.1 IS3 family transposase [Streptomyces sp. RLB1-8]